MAGSENVSSLPDKVKSDVEEGISTVPVASDGDAAEELYSVFSKSERRWIVFTVSFAAMFSGLSSFIYYPAITPLSKSLRTSVELINLTVTSYMIVAGVAPSVIGDMADQTGRRPVYIVAFAIYFASNVGLALQNSYPALFVLRMLQSAGSSGTFAIAFGVIADIAPPAERGSRVGILMGFTNAAPSLGPVLGGILAQRLGWRWVFWLLSIISGLNFLGLVLFFPETLRKLVGNGSIPAKGANRTIVSALRHRTSASLGTVQQSRERGFHVPNPMASLRLLFDRNTASTICIGSAFYMLSMSLAASLSVLLMDLYGLNELEAGLAYLPSGIGGLVGSQVSGKLLDRDYRITAKHAGHEIDRRSGDDLSRYPIEKSRLRSTSIFVAANVTTVVGYGWALKARSHIAVPLVLQFITGVTRTSIFTFSVMTVPKSSAIRVLFKISTMNAHLAPGLWYSSYRPQSALFLYCTGLI
ncbi:hypothetical protein FGG08_006573 [Glutinoglossum americanum]|uniref:Major facilitator superfamily (MFS) profile domain-containing protein n=1 Tax=Glutinoglossum americanum TaxID=1670608 RepID=A0A9P8HY14_9PEZI|nr:hypothetical protein FGG08_006573 [Glutinoglossum americanum]